MRSLAILSALAATAAASFAGNLNYRSPSHNHPGLGVSIHRVAKRNVEVRQEQYASSGTLNFTHGVASGDPYPSSVILWARIAPMMDNDMSNNTVEGIVGLYNHATKKWINRAKNAICVQYRVGLNDQLDRVVDEGKAYTTSDIDYTVKVEATGLQPFTTYYYQFTSCDDNSIKSPVGRTKTSPAPYDEVTSIKLAVFSCSNYPFGFFNAYGNPARKDSVDYVIHLGDYIYEYKNGDYGNGRDLGRIPQPNREIYTLYDYRRRIATYRTDFDLLLSHQQNAWIPVWDDHEVSDNTYRDGASGLFNNEGSFVRDGGVSFDQRKMNAVRAYFEWMPIRQVDLDDNLRIWRNFKLGNLIDLIMLDTRQYDRSITDLYTNVDYIHEISNDASRSLMGPRQEKWFYQSLSDSADRGAAWRIIGSQITFSRLNESKYLGKADPLNYDSWDGYVANRNRTLHHLAKNNIGNNIFLAGDSHVNWVSDLVWLNDTEAGGDNYNQKTGEGAMGVEFAGTAVTSPCPFDNSIKLKAAEKVSDWLVGANRELQWQESFYRGYYELHVSHEKVDALFFGAATLVTRNPFETPLANFTVVSGQNRLKRPIGGGVVETGSIQGLKNGGRMNTNLTNDTSVAGGRWFVSHFDKYISL